MRSQMLSPKVITLRGFLHCIRYTFERTFCGLERSFYDSCDFPEKETFFAIIITFFLSEVTGNVKPDMRHCRPEVVEIEEEEVNVNKICREHLG